MKAVVLFSLGIDSPVATHIAKSNLIDLIGINFYSKNLSDKYRKDIIKLANLVGLKKLYFVDHSISHLEYAKKCNKRYQCVFCKRMMLRIAEKILEKENYDFILTGDNIGQVATQTINNMKIISQVTNKMILRPVLTFDKNVIVNIAKEIKSFEINNKNNSPCPFLPDNPVTKINKEKIQIEEDKLDIDNILQAMFSKIEFEIIKEIK